MEVEQARYSCSTLTGPAYRFSAYHVMDVMEGEGLPALFPLSVEQL